MVRRASGQLAFVALLASVACAGPSEPTTHLDELDMTPAEGAEFDPNRVLSLEEIADASVDRKLLRALLTYRAVEKERRSPYGHDSFLATYFSNGVSAVDALLSASEKHRINPLVLLARVEMAQGLVALQYYPPERSRDVEYVLGCGCAGPAACDVKLAGFDRQVDCLARQYRSIIDEMDAAGGVTSGGWGPGRESVTLDGQRVTPADAGTAVLYQLEPLVGDDKSGNRLFWNIWKLYVRASGYQAPSVDATKARFVGDGCVNDAQCGAIPGGICIPYSGGMCSARCDSVACPTRDGVSTYCVTTDQGGAFCFADCNTNVPSSCRAEDPAWACCVTTTGNAGDKSVCMPAEPGRPRTCRTQ